MDRKPKYSQIVFDKERFTNEVEMFAEIGKQLQILLHQGYTAVVRYDEPSLGIAIIEFEHDEHFEPWGCSTPMWVTTEEAEEVLDRRCQNESEE